MKVENKNLLIVLILIVIVLICLGIYVKSAKSTSYAISDNIKETNKENIEEKEPVTVIFLNEKIENEDIKLRNNSDAVKEKLAKNVDSLKNKKIVKEENSKIENTEEVSSNTQVDESALQEQQVQETYVQPNSYYIRVNYTANVVNVYSMDTSGNLVDCVKAFTCSTGTATPTSGVYQTDYKYRWISLFGNVYGQYGTRIVGNILFHSVPYTENENKASLEYWEYDKLGTSASAGCVRLTVEAAKWIYENCKSGTSVEFYSDENPGPLRKTRNTKNFRI